MLKDFLKRIKDCPAEYRGAPFWAWNDRLSPERLRGQIREMKAMGFGGFFMHSRFGLKTPYLGDGWIECIRACIDEAKKLGMHAWLYDEDRWPSGTAGGMVTKNNDYAMRGLDYELSDTTKYAASDLAWFAIYFSNDAATSFRWLKHGDVLREGEKFIRFIVKTAPPSNSNNESPYIDTMNPAAVAEFIRSTHDKYAEKIEEEFGATVPGIFTDEPNYNTFLYKQVWTDALPEEFQTKFGYNIVQRLPELFFEFNENKTSKVRLDFYNLITGLFVNAFSKQIGDWCEAHGLKFTGHVLGEDNLLSQMQCVGSAMRFYEYMQIPGIDVLTERWNIFDAAKQCSSVAHQLGRESRLTELYGCTGWDFPFEGHKAVGDWQAALGINLRCHHLVWYSMGGESKRDYPASISAHSPWWEQYHVVEDYFARIFAALSFGEEVREVLVIHPVESLWFYRPLDCYGKEERINMNGHFVHTGNEKLNENGRLSYIRKELLKNNIDFDYGDEDMMSRHGAVEGEKFRVGEARYRSVIIPELRTIRTSTLRLLSEFAANGGQVCYIGAPPSYVNGVKSVEATDAYRSFIPAMLSTLSQTVSEAARHISITASGEEIEPLLHNLHQAKDFSTLFICNTSMMFIADEHNAPRVVDRELEYPKVSVDWKLPEEFEVYEVDLSADRIMKVNSSYVGGKRRFDTSFRRLASRLFVACGENISNNIEPAFAGQELLVEVPFQKNFKFDLDEENCFVLDNPEYSLDGSMFYPRKTFLQVDDIIREQHLNIARRSGGMLQPWYDSGEDNSGKNVEVKLRYEFTCEKIPSTLSLGIENPLSWKIYLNGCNVPKEDEGYWCDPAIRKIKLPLAQLATGKNELIIYTSYSRFFPGLEAIFLFGDFGVTPDGALNDLPKTLVPGDWCEQGLPHYAGNLSYIAQVEYCSGRLFIDFPKWSGVALGISVNGSDERLLPWPPYRLELTPMLVNGRNTLKIKVYGHRRNALGPFYAGKYPEVASPTKFRACEYDSKQLVACGLLETPVISCLVQQ